MRKFGLIGFPLSHSFSETYFREKFSKENIKDCQYKNLPIREIEKIKNLVENEKLTGFNVTTPHKESIIEYLDSLSKDAEEIGAVNTVYIKNNKWIGYNTDWIGFYESIKPLLKNHHKKALILGNGGASKAIIYALKKLKIKHETVSRKKNLSYSSLTESVFSEYQLIVNCTPLGTFPKIDEYPNIPYHLLNKDYLLYDLVYNPNKSRFLLLGLTHGCDIKNGLEMLHRQAEEAWIVWNS